MADSPEGEGATEVGPETATTEDTGAPGGTTAAEGRTSEDAPEETFFDPKDIPEELQPAYKNMQAAFTKKTQAIRENKKKIEAYDSFLSNPHESIQSLAKQLGYELKQPGKEETGEWQPESWDDVFSRAKQEVLKEMQPLLNEVRNVKKTHIEKVLDDEVPEWRQYEDEMMDALKKHPSLANEPASLARIALPQEVIEGKAYQRALKKLEAKGQSSKVSKGSTTHKEPPVKPKGNLTFAEAYELARKQAESELAA